MKTDSVITAWVITGDVNDGNLGELIIEMNGSDNGLYLYGWHMGLGRATDLKIILLRWGSFSTISDEFIIGLECQNVGI